MTNGTLTLTDEQKQQRLIYLEASIKKAKEILALLTQQLQELNDDADGTHGEDRFEAATSKQELLNNITRCMKSINDYETSRKAIKQNLGLK